MKFFILFFFLLLITPLSASDLSLVEGCREYVLGLEKTSTQEKDVHFSHAKDIFLQFLSTTTEPHPYIDYNLGTIYLSSKEYAKAIVHLKRAHRHLSDDPRVIKNLRRAGKAAGVQLFPQKQQNLISILQQWWTSTPPKTLQILALLFSWLSAFFCFFIVRNNRVLFTFVLIMTLLLSSAALLRTIDIGIQKEAILLNPYKPHTGLGENYPSVFLEDLKAGTPGIILRQEMGWVQIKWISGNHGWVPAHLINQTN